MLIFILRIILGKNYLILERKDHNLIDETLKKSGISDEGELINNALTLFDFASEQVIKGNKLAIIDGEEKTYSVLDIEAFKIKI